MSIKAFSIARLPRIEFGAGSIAKLPPIAQSYGSHALILTGHQSFVETSHWAQLKNGFEKSGIHITHIKRSAGEPTPEQVDEKTAALSGARIDVVIGIGGGSVLDEAKAIAGLLRVNHSVMDYLEGVGPQLSYEGPSTPFIAVPTTAGTGSEATKNAVLSRHGKGGFKKSFRDDQLVAQWAIIDPDLLATCPRSVLAGNGMDAVTQLLESYLSTKANPFTDALALQGLEAANSSLQQLYESDGEHVGARENMALASLLSGICLAQTGLGSVHGLASPLGAFFPIPHGICCGVLVAGATRINITALRSRSENDGALDKYARIGRLFGGDQNLPQVDALDRLDDQLARWTLELKLPRLSDYGVTREDFPRIIENISPSSMKTNPLALEDREITQLLDICL